MASSAQTTSIAVAAILLAFSTQQGGADEIRLSRPPVAEQVSDNGQGALVGVKMDFARILAFAEPARTVIIGNPGIVDGTLSDDHTIVLTGKALGATNLIVLGEGGREVLSATVSVTQGRYQTTTVYSGAELKTFSCAESCRPMLSIGDDGTHFSKARDQIKERQDLLGGGTVTR